MKIAVLSSHTPSLFWFRMDMMKTMQMRGHEVFALGNESENEWEQRFAGQGVTYRQINVQRNGLNPFNDLRTLLSIKKVLIDIKPDKVFTYQAKTVIYGGIVANQLGINAYPLIAGMGSVFLKNDLKTKLIRKTLVIEYKMGMRNASSVFFQNQDDLVIFRTYGIIKNQPIVMIPGSGVNTEKFTPCPLPKNFAFLCVSRLIRDKGVYEYLQACRRIKRNYPDIRCLLVGPYDSNPSAIKPDELQPFIDNGVEYYGEQTDVRPYLAECNVFVLPSYREGTPKTNLEAMASARAVITTDAPGCRETVKDMVNGLLVPIKNVDKLVEKMEWCINHPKDVQRFGNVGRDMAKKNFDVRIVNSKICETMKI